jgi:inosine/xanthosine triphosphatase
VEPKGHPDLNAAVGSTNPVKVAATRAVLSRIYATTNVMAVPVESGVSHQPWGDEEAARGAINRARAAQERTGAEIGVGFEGSVLEVGGDLFTAAWCAVTRSDGVVGIAGGESVLLPPSVAAAVRSGMELGPAMDGLTGQHNTKQAEGAIGILTGGWLDRQSAYEHLLIMALARFLAADYYEQEAM